MASGAEREFEAHARWLMAPGPHGRARPRRINTHTAAIFLRGDRALKLRRPVNYGWLDYSTRARRLAAARREAASNDRTAPGLCLGVFGILGDGEGFRLVRETDLPDRAEPVTVMRRFPDEALFDRMATDGRLTAALMHQTGRVIAAMHREALPRPGTGDLPGLARGHDPQLRGLGRLLGPGVEQLLAAMAEAHRRLRPALERRRARRCHGDLHLGNIVLWRGAPAPFDAIDFNDAFTDIDPLFDLAFLLMDLDHRGHAELGPSVIGAWAEAMAGAPGADVETAYGGFALLPLYKGVRAAIRAKVGALSAEATGAAPAGEGGRPDFRLAEAGAYLDLALGCLAAQPAPRLVALGGLSGTGKSTIARAIAARTGALVLRSDGTRKGLHGVPETERLAPGAYSRAAGERVYGELLVRVALVLGAGHPVIVDAAHLRPEERGAVEAIACRLGVPFNGIWLDAPPADLRARVAARRDDVSDADAAVVTIQLGRDPGPIAWTRIAACGPVGETVALAAAQLGL